MSGIQVYEGNGDPIPGAGWGGGEDLKVEAKLYLPKDSGWWKMLPNGGDWCYLSMPQIEARKSLSLDRRTCPRMVANRLYVTSYGSVPIVAHNVTVQAIDSPHWHDGDTHLFCTLWADRVQVWNVCPDPDAAQALHRWRVAKMEKDLLKAIFTPANRLP
jgi:hypothetical protein